MDSLARMAGGSAVVAGLSWCAAAVIHNTQPQGCVGESCAVTPMREATPLTDMLFLLAGVTLAASLGGLLVMARRRGASARTAWTALAACALAMALFATAALMSVIHPDWNGMPFVVVPAVAALVVGLVLVVVLVLKARLLPKIIGVVVLASVALLPVANEQTSRVMWAVPFGLAWAVVGVLLLTARQDTSGEHA